MLRLPQIPRRSPLVISLADDRDRLAIYSIRHDVYGRELRQHAENADGMLRDRLDDVNTYIVATESRSVVGFVAVTPPNAYGYSIDKYFDRTATGLRFDHGLYEVRLLTVVEAYRHTQLAALLMYAALRYVESRGATTIAAIGRLELLRLYERVGLCRRGLRAQAGAVTYELMSAEVENLRASQWESVIQRMQRSVEWRLPGVSYRDPVCYHGGAFWESMGDQFTGLEHRDAVVSADVLDAWFDPAPSVIQRLSESLPFVLKTSPPTHADCMTQTIASTRGVQERSIVPGAGSSDLIFAAFRHWVTPSMRTLILDPMYGEYAHVLERAIGAKVHRLKLRRGQQYDLDVEQLTERLGRGYDWVVLVNPNSPTGRHADRDRLIEALNAAHPRTRVWIDETYIDYVGSLQSLEGYAASSSQVFVCKSMSKVYALSGVRAAYLVGPERLISELRQLRPPWAVSLPAQIAACEALRATDYYEAKWQETHALREELQQGLSRLGWDVTSGCANFLLCHLPASGPRAPAVIDAARARGVFIRNVESMGTSLGARAVRVAVKDQATNARTLAVLADIMSEVSSGALS